MFNLDVFIGKMTRKVNWPYNKKKSLYSYREVQVIYIYELRKYGIYIYIHICE